MLGLLKPTAPAYRTYVRLVPALLLAAAVAASCGWLLAREDGPVGRDLHRVALRSPGLVRVAEDVTFLGSGRWFYPLVTAVVVVLLVRGRRRDAAFLAVTCLTAGLVNSGVKAVVGRSRPSFTEVVATAGGKSFPSGHAMSSTAIYGALLLLALPAVRTRRARVALAAATALLVVAIGFTRVLLGVHYLSDVVAGHLFGLAWLLLWVAIFRPTRPTPPELVAETAS